MKEGNIVLTPITQTDGQVKNRLAVVLRCLPPYNNLLTCLRYKYAITALCEGF